MALERRQKVLLALIIIAFAYVSWQSYDMFFAEKPGRSITVSPIAHLKETSVPSLQKTPAPTPEINTQPKTITQTSPTTEPTLTPVTKASVITPQQATSQSTTQTEPTPQRPHMSATQREYLQLINQYQILKMKRLLLQEQVSIAEAREKIATLNKETKGFTDGNMLGLSHQTGTSGLRLLYVDYQAGRWVAMLSMDDHYKTVYVGSQLPDGTRVIHINRSSLTLKENGDKFKLTFSGITGRKPLRSPTVQSIKPVTIQKPVVTPALKLPSAQSSNTPVTLTPAQNKTLSTIKKMLATEKKT